MARIRRAAPTVEDPENVVTDYVGEDAPQVTDASAQLYKDNSGPLRGKAAEVTEGAANFASFSKTITNPEGAEG